ncbi:MAG: arginine repressor [Lachnospiraceae bacterium]|nr:arginine repressor [Lachnospiraceae bacterium]
MKPDRKTKILELIGKYNISNQEELRGYLLKEGYDVTQGTVSKDMRTLMLTKVQGTDGKLYYKAVSTGVDMTRKYLNILRDGFISMTPAMNILVIKTVSGMAMACAAAIEELNIMGIAGCIAGDDTIFLAIRSEEECLAVMQELSRLFEDDKSEG